MTPLHLATETGRIQVLKCLVEQGADIDIQDDKGVIIRLYIPLLVDL